MDLFLIMVATLIGVGYLQGRMGAANQALHSALRMHDPSLESHFFPARRTFPLTSKQAAVAPLDISVPVLLGLKRHGSEHPEVRLALTRARRETLITVAFALAGMTALLVIGLSHVQ